MQFEQSLIEHGALTLAGLKPASLFRFLPGEGGDFVGRFLACRALLDSRGLELTILKGCRRRGEYLLCLYRRRGLAAVLIPLIGWPALFIGLYYAADKTPLAWLLDSILAGIVYTVLPSWTFIMDGGITYILEGIVLYLLRRHRGWQAAVFVALGLLFYLALPMRYLMASGSFAPGLLFDTAFEWMGVFAVVPMLLYNGQRGRGMKQLFYVFYPAHVYLLYALSWGVLLLTQ